MERNEPPNKPRQNLNASPGEDRLASAIAENDAHGIAPVRPTRSGRRDLEKSVGRIERDAASWIGANDETSAL